jgi:hypothetical protein
MSTYNSYSANTIRNAKKKNNETQGWHPEMSLSVIISALYFLCKTKISKYEYISVLERDRG